MPVTAISCQTGGLDTQHRTDLSGANLSGQTLETRLFHQTGTRSTEIFIQDGDLLETQLTRPLDKSILAALALLVVDQLASGELADVNDRTAA